MFDKMLIDMCVPSYVCVCVILVYVVNMFMIINQGVFKKLSVAFNAPTI